MLSPKSKWSKELVVTLASACKTKTEFRIKHSGAYMWAHKNNFLESICEHMVAPKRENKWSLDNVKLRAKTYSTRNTFRKEDSGAYNWARVNGFLDDVCSHMVGNQSFDFGRVKTIADQYLSRGEFAKNNEAAYRWAIRNNSLTELTSHMSRPKTESKWTLKEAQLAALKCKSKKEFKAKYGGAYSWAYKNSLLDEMCSHMEVIGSQYKRALYVYEFDNNKAYVGLTFNYHERHLSHKRKGPVYKESKNASYKFIKLQNWMEPKLAQAAEIELIEKYYADGWELLNTVKGGGLGGSELKWNNELIRKESLKYKKLKDFRDKSPSAYTIASTSKLLESFTHLERERTFWNLESVKVEGKKYSTRSEFSVNAAGASDWARNNNVFDEVCSHMDYVRKSWDIKSVFNEAEKYKSKSDFQKHSGSAWMWAQRNNMLDQVCQHMHRPKKGSKWDINKVSDIAKQHSTKSDFKRYASGAYQWSRKNNLLDEICNHMQKLKS